MVTYTTPPPATPVAVPLDAMRFQADPWADQTIATILGHWDEPSITNNEAASAEIEDHWRPQWQKLAAVNRVFSAWSSNTALQNWRADGAGMPADVAVAIENYVQAAKQMPDWVDREKIARAETLFVEHGALSVTLLFCASLPQCYVVPDLSAVLQVTGKLEEHTEYRVRSTGAMIFPVMMKGGLTGGNGAGLAQIFKVRLIHATVRHLILRQSPQLLIAKMDTAKTLGGAEGRGEVGLVAPLDLTSPNDTMHHALFVNGWDTEARGLPCNQEELAYTLLTFSYVFLQGLRSLGVGLPKEDEEAYLHAWNLCGHFLGIQRALMANTMDEAKRMFDDMQARGRKGQPVLPDPRPKLGSALMNAMSTVIPFKIAKPFPVLMTRFLCGSASSKDLGLNGAVSWASKSLFYAIMLVARLIDHTVRKFSPQFSMCRFITRVLGYQLITRLMMDQTRPLRVPEHLSSDMDVMLNRWGRDRLAPAWLNKFEGLLTTKNGWGSENKTN